MTAVLPDGSPYPATRGELLARRVVEVGAARRRALSPLRSLLAVPVMVVGILIGGAWYPAYDEEFTAQEGRIVAGFGAAVVFVLVLLLALIALGTRRRHRLAWRWMAVERTAMGRSLPPGEIDPRLVEPFDLRDDEHLAQRASDVSVQMSLDVNRVGLSWVLVLTFVAVLGSVPVLAAMQPDVAPTWGRWWLLTLGLFVMVPALVSLGGRIREGGRRQAWANLVDLENRLLQRRQALLNGDDRAVGARPMIWALPVLVGLLSFLGLLFMARLALYSLTGLLAALVVLLVLAAVVGLSLLRRRGLHAVPLLGEGPSVTEAPARAVDIAVVDGAVRVSPIAGGAARPVDIPLADVLAVEPISWGSPLTPPTVALITRHAPVVLSGRGVESHPVIAALRERLSPQGA